MLIIWSPEMAIARSAYSPRHTGMEPPGGPRPLDNMPSRSPGRTAEGGIGYTDAYGNTIKNHDPSPKISKNRLSPGAYGNYGKKVESQELPNPDKNDSSPLWNFN